MHGTEVGIKYDDYITDYDYLGFAFNQPDEYTLLP